MSDYKKLYLEQKVQALKMELDLLSVRFTKIQEELPLIVKELEEYLENKEKKEEKQKDK